MIDKCIQMNKEYNCIPSTEIWSKNSIQNTLNQIEYAVDAYFIKDKKLLIRLYQQVENTIYDVEEHSVNGTKGNELNSGYFIWSICENIASTTYLFKSNDNMGCYQRFNTFNTLQTNDHAYCNEVDLWIGNVFKESTCFSGQSEKQRNGYVTSTIDVINAAKNQISHLQLS